MEISLAREERKRLSAHKTQRKNMETYHNISSAMRRLESQKANKIQ
jgi:hypothetical protein